MEIHNKPLFYAGLSLQIVPLIVGALIGIIYALSLLDWTWVLIIIRIIFDIDKLKYYLVGLFFILYEGVSLLMIWAGCRK